MCWDSVDGVLILNTSNDPHGTTETATDIHVDIEHTFQGWAQVMPKALAVQALMAYRLASVRTVDFFVFRSVHNLRFRKVVKGSLEWQIIYLLEPKEIGLLFRVEEIPKGELHARALANNGGKFGVFIKAALGYPNISKRFYWFSLRRAN